MPKRKATGPAESDGEEEEFYSFPATPAQSPFPKSNNFNLLASQRPLGGGGGGGTASTSTTSNAMFSFGGGGGAKRTMPGRVSYGGLNHSSSAGVGTATTANVETLATSNRFNSSSASGSSAGNEDFTKSMRDLNNSFHHSVRNAVTKNASHSLLPLVKDYLFHSRVLLEQHKKGSSQSAGVNGIDLPPKTFRSLGEFFDELETRYIQNNQRDDEGTIHGSTLRQDTGSALNSNFSSTTESSSRSNFNSTFSAPSLTPKPADNTKTTESTHPDASRVKLSSLQTSTSTTATADKPISSGFFTNTIPSVPNPLKPTSSPTATPLKPTECAPPVSKPMAATPFTGFSFFTTPAASSAPPSTLPSPATTASTEAQNNEEEGEDDEPPKVEITQVKEDDAVYSIRCKVFGVVDGKPKDKGIGMLYVKKLEDGKHQIVVRADNNLGTVILNLLLQKSLPLEKNGKNSIMTVDLTANDKKGMPIFIRVKTEADALELLEKLKEFQQAS